MTEDSQYVMSLKAELSARMYERTEMINSDPESNSLDIIHIDNLIEEIKEMIWEDVNK